MTPLYALFYLTLGMDGVAILSLLSTGEIPLAVGVLVGVTFLIALATRFGKTFTLSTAAVAALIASTIAATLGFWWGLKQPLLISVSEGTLLLHTILWTVTTQGRGFALRMSVGFFELLIAAIMTSDLYLIFSVFAFAILGALAISCNFLASTQNQASYLPKGFLSRSALVGAMVLLSGILIFPILPRTQRFSGFGPAGQVGYTETVSFANLSELTGSGSGKSVLRITDLEGTFSSSELTFLFGTGLFRGRVLSSFDGDRWEPNNKAKIQNTPVPSALASDRDFTFEVWREPLGSPILPLPYRAKMVSIDSLQSVGQSSFLSRLESGEWLQYFSNHSKARYRFVLAPGSQASLLDTPPKADLPVKDDLFLPEKIKTDRLRDLSTRFFVGNKDKREGMRQWLEFLRGNFKGSVKAQPTLPEDVMKLHPLERFLFFTKTGHCEEFAGSTAVLLRLAGIPSRLIAGFRISRPAVAGTLHIRSGDAHAWVEYWIPEEGWLPVDPTPRSPVSLSLWSRFQSSFETAYEFLDNYWYRYFVAFNSESQLTLGKQVTQGFQLMESSISMTTFSALKRQLGWMGLFLALVITSVITALGIRGILSKHFKMEARTPLVRERIQMESMLKRFERKRLSLSFEAQHLNHAWKELYLRTRFGKKQPALADLEGLKTLRKQLHRLLQSEK